MDFFRNRHYSKVAVLVDNNTRQHCYPVLSEVIPKHFIIEIPAGEVYKNLQTCEYIWNALTNEAFDRKALLVNLGGGVIGDMGGFCAATYKRGIEFINIPTTLLAQVDASIGGKLGIDFHGFKNQIGVFQNPNKVFLDPSFFTSLAPAELRSGFAEIIKHCLIRDENTFNRIKNSSFESLDLYDLVQHSVTIKHDVVTEDPTEKGLRKILNFGHTIGHAVESFYLEKPGKRLLHGEAIAVGMICESWLSGKKLGLNEEDMEEICQYITSIFSPKRIPESDFREIMALTAQDKKNEKDAIQCSLLRKNGDCVFNIPIDNKEIEESLKYFNRIVVNYTK